MKKFLKKLYIYQKERFPLLILLFTTLVTIICIAVITETELIFRQFLLIYFCALSFLFHFRVIDEIRDFSHDKKHHPKRPVHRGLITIRELLIIDIILLTISFIITFFQGMLPFLISLIFILFSIFSLKNFGLKKFFEGRLILYHLVNSPSMVLIFLFILASLTSTLVLSNIIVLYLLFYYINIFLLEIGRKIYLDEKKIKSLDTYSYSMGLDNALFLLISLLITNYLLFIFIILVLNSNSVIIFLISFFVVLFSILTLIYYRYKPLKKINKLAQLSLFIFFIALNLLIYFS